MVIAAALIAAGLGGWQAGLIADGGPHVTAASSPSGPPSPPRTLVRPPSLVGHLARAVLASFRRLGLRPRLAWLPASAQPPGTVLSVNPSGALSSGTVVAVTAAARP